MRDVPFLCCGLKPWIQDEIKHGNPNWDAERAHTESVEDRDFMERAFDWGGFCCLEIPAQVEAEIVSSEEVLLLEIEF